MWSNFICIYWSNLTTNQNGPIGTIRENDPPNTHGLNEMFLIISVTLLKISLQIFWSRRTWSIQNNGEETLECACIVNNKLTWTIKLFYLVSFYDFLMHSPAARRLFIESNLLHSRAKIVRKKVVVVDVAGKNARKRRRVSPYVFF